MPYVELSAKTGEKVEDTISNFCIKIFNDEVAKLISLR